MVVFKTLLIIIMIVIMLAMGIDIILMLADLTTTTFELDGEMTITEPSGVVTGACYVDSFGNYAHPVDINGINLTLESTEEQDLAIAVIYTYSTEHPSSDSYYRIRPVYAQSPPSISLSDNAAEKSIHLELYGVEGVNVCNDKFLYLTFWAWFNNGVCVNSVMDDIAAENDLNGLSRLFNSCPEYYLGSLNVPIRW